MAVVFLASEIERFDAFSPYNSFVALKQLSSKYSSQEGFVKCLIDEAKLTSILKHPNIVEVLDLGNVGTDFYLTMNWVDGKSFYNLLETVRSQNKVISKPFLFYIFQNVAQGLHYAHEMKDSANRPLEMVHCDISPQNILIGYEGQVKLSDFGIATAEKSKDRAVNEALLGKLPYMAPEQITLKGFDRRVDIYSFGVLMYEGMTGRKPFSAATVQQLQTKIIKEQPQFTSRAFQASPNVKAFIEACLSKDPQNRPASISEFFKLSTEVEDVDQTKISKLMKLLFKNEISREKANINAAIEVLGSIKDQPDLLSDDDNSFASAPSEKSIFRPTEIMPANASYEMTKVVMENPEKESVAKVQVEKREILRIIKKKPIEEEWIDSETTQRRMSREMAEAAKLSEIKEARNVEDLFEQDSDEEQYKSPAAVPEKTTIDFDESMEKKWEQLQKNLRKKRESDNFENETKQQFSNELRDRSDEIVDPFHAQNSDALFQTSYPATGEHREFSKFGDSAVSAPVEEPKKTFEQSENETKEAKIQLRVVKGPLHTEKPKPKPFVSSLPEIKSEVIELAPRSRSNEFLEDASKPRITEPRFDYKKILPSNETVTLQIGKRTLFFVAAGLLGVVIAFFGIKSSISFYSVRAPVAVGVVNTVDLYVSIEDMGDAQQKSSVSLWMDPTFQKNFMDPIQNFFAQEFHKYTNRDLPPYRFAFKSLERGTPKIPWQGGLFNSFLPFEKFYNIFQIDSNADLKDHARVFVHLYQKELNGPTEYPIDYQGQRPTHSGVLYYPLFAEDDHEFQLRLAHEILHALGAKDLYNSKGLPKYPEGYVDPFKEPLHPQTYGEIMSRTIPQNPSEYIPLSSLEYARIGPSTAQAIGWISENQMNRAYQR